MKISGFKREPVEVEITENDLLKLAEDKIADNDFVELVKARLYKKMKLPIDAFIKGTEWYHEVIYLTSHSWFSDEHIRSVTEHDKRCLSIIDSITKIYTGE